MISPSLDNMQSETHNRCCLYLAWPDIKLYYSSDVRIRTSRNMKQVGRYGLRDFAWFARSMHPGMHASRESRLSTSWIINWARESSWNRRVRPASFATLYSGVRSLAYIWHWRHADCWAWFVLAIDSVDWLAKFPQWTWNNGAKRCESMNRDWKSEALMCCVNAFPAIWY